MELKQAREIIAEKKAARINRTFMELKLRCDGDFLRKIPIVLIEPLWN